MLAVVILIFIAMALLDFPEIIRSKRWYDFWVLGGFYIIAFTLVAMQALGVTLPSPIMGIEKVIVEVLHLGYPNP